MTDNILRGLRYHFSCIICKIMTDYSSTSPSTVIWYDIYQLISVQQFRRVLSLTGCIGCIGLKIPTQMVFAVDVLRKY